MINLGDRKWTVIVGMNGVGKTDELQRLSPVVITESDEITTREYIKASSVRPGAPYTVLVLVARILSQGAAPVVAIDDLGSRMHPRLQSTIVETLRNTFPDKQFVAATHAPLVLAGCQKGEVWQMKRNSDTGEVIAEQSHAQPALFSGSELNEMFDESHNFLHDAQWMR